MPYDPPPKLMPSPDAGRRAFLKASLLGLGSAFLGVRIPLGHSGKVNAPQIYPKELSRQLLHCVVDADVELGSIDRRIFGTNLEWFNHGDGFASSDPAFAHKLVTLAREEGITVFRFPGGILADYYHWRDGTGPRASRPVRKHPTDSGWSRNDFGSPEFFRLLQATGAQGLLTVNAGTGTAEEAAQWVAYANRPHNARRKADGFPHPVGIKLWEVGNELYLPANPGEKKIGVTPEVYAHRFIDYAKAMRAVDPSIRVLGIGVAQSHGGPHTPYPDWSEKLLQRAAADLDMLAVHNAYFPLLYHVRQPSVEEVYPALWAAPEAVDRSLHQLETLIARYEKQRRIGIAVTEWGLLYSLPRADPYWVDHVKTLGSGIYVARLLQVFMSHPRLELANYFKFVDRGFMGWVSFAGKPKVPYWVFELYARHSGERRVRARVDSPTYDTGALGAMYPEKGVAEVTVLATKRAGDGRLFVNFVNRSMRTIHRVRVRFNNFTPRKAEQFMITGNEPTAHNGNDIPPEWPFKPEYDPYTTAPPDSIKIVQSPWPGGNVVEIPPFSVVTVAVDG